MRPKLYILHVSNHITYTTQEKTHVFLHIVLSSSNSILSQLHTHLSRHVIDTPHARRRWNSKPRRGLLRRTRDRNCTSRNSSKALPLWLTISRLRRLAISSPRVLCVLPIGRYRCRILGRRGKSHVPAWRAGRHRWFGRCCWRVSRYWVLERRWRARCALLIV